MSIKEETVAAKAAAEEHTGDDTHTESTGSAAPDRAPSDVCAKKNESFISKLGTNIREKLLVKCSILALISLIGIGISLLLGDIEIGASVIRDINILLISTNATLIGLYVTAFIFLNDSLKTRVKEDPTLAEAVAKILQKYRNDMLYISILTGATIFAEIMLNISLGSGMTDGDLENWCILLSDPRWLLFIPISVFSIAVMVWIIQCSKQITHSDSLIKEYSQKNLEEHGNNINAHFEKIRDLYNKSREKKDENRKFPDLYKDENWEKTLSEILDGKEEDILEELTPDASEMSEDGSYLTSYFGLKSNKYTEKSVDIKDEDISREMEIIFGKRVRFLENIITKICENNIDKSIMSDEFKYDSMCSGFQWLYAQKINQKDIDKERREGPDGESKRPDMTVDIREEKRFLDYIKYQIITQPVFINYRPYNNAEVEDLFDKLVKKFNTPAFVAAQTETTRETKEERTEKGTRRTVIEETIEIKSGENAKSQYQKKNKLINRYKSEMYGIIKEFFVGYRNVVGYRDALIHFKKFSTSDTCADAMQERKSITNRISRINEYTELLIRIMIDRFTSFVKISNLNLGNTTFDKGWFNYSELSDSNFTHSSFIFTRIENAIVRNCDLSTCNFINADASGTDFSNSNFSYSNLTGADLSNTLIDNAQMNSVLFRDKLIDKYDGLYLLFDHLDDQDKSSIFPSKEKFEELIKNTPTEFKGPDVSKIIGKTVREYRNALILDESDLSVDVKCETPMSGMFGLFTHLKEQHEDYKLPDKCFAMLERARKAEAKYSHKKKEEELKTDPKSKYTRESLHGKVRFGVAKLDSVSGSNVKLKNVDFSYVDMDDSSLTDSDLSNAEMYYTYARNAMFRSSNLNELDAYKSDFKNANFSEANLMNSLFLDCDIREANFGRAILLHSTIATATKGTDLVLKRFTEDIKAGNGDNILSMMQEAVESVDTKTDRGITDVLTLVENERQFGLPRNEQENKERRTTTASCSDGVFVDILANDISIISMNMIRADFTGATMKDAVLYNNLMRWCELVNSTITNALVVGTSFTHSTFENANLSRSKFYACEFTNVSFKKTNLISTHISKSLFANCTFGGTEYAPENAILSQAEIYNCSFYNCNFADVNVSGTVFKNCIFYGYDLTKAIGLESASFINCIFKKGPNDYPKKNRSGMIDLREGVGTSQVLLVEIKGDKDAPARFTSQALATPTDEE